MHRPVFTLLFFTTLVVQGVAPSILADESVRSARPSVVPTFDLSNPLESLAGELIEYSNLSEREYSQAKREMVARARLIYRKCQLEHDLERYNVADSSQLDALLQESGSSLAAREADFVWRILIGELKRNPASK